MALFQALGINSPALGGGLTNSLRKVCNSNLGLLQVTLGLIRGAQVFEEGPETLAPEAWPDFCITLSRQTVGLLTNPGSGEHAGGVR